MVSERVGSLCFTVSSSSSAIPLMLTRSPSWPCWHCLLPTLADPYIFWSASTARNELPKEATLLQPPKNDPYLEFFTAAFLNGPCEEQGKESGRAVPFGIALETTTGGRRRRVVWGRVAPPEWRKLLSDQCGTLHLKAVVRKKMKLFRKASHLWLIFHSNTCFLKCIFQQQE